MSAEDSYRFRLPGFEGPLDLLLHLVRVNELDILDLPIFEVARQYEEYLDLMREMNLEVAGEYLVMAATLLHIKSRMLLHADPSPDEDGQPSEDPRAELAQQLLEYQKYRQGRTREGRAWARLLEERHNPEVEAIIGDAVDERRDEWRLMVTRAIDRGDLPPRTDAQLLLDFVRAIVDSRSSSRRLDAAWLNIAVRTVIAGARAGTLSSTVAKRSRRRGLP